MTKRVEHIPGVTSSDGKPLFKIIAEGTTDYYDLHKAIINAVVTGTTFAIEDVEFRPVDLRGVNLTSGIVGGNVPFQAGIIDSNVSSIENKLAVPEEETFLVVLAILASEV